MEQPEVWTFVSAMIREMTLGEDGWPIAWCGGGWVSHGNNKVVHQATALFDRDRCTLERAHTIARAAESKFRRVHPKVDPLELYAQPTTRSAVALEYVREHFSDVSEREVEKMRRGGASWLWVSDIVVKLGWTSAEDRVVVELVAESSVDERNAELLGREWLAELVARVPEIASIVDVVGSSH